MHIQVQRATKDQQSIISNLSQFYIYEFGPLRDGITLREDGLYQPLDLDEYWTSCTHHPFLVTVDGELAGFVLVVAGDSERPNDIEEFFVLRKFNGKGVGRVVAWEIFDRFPGRWKITQIRKNYSAQAFWRSVIGRYTSENFKEYYDDYRRSVQEFDNTSQGA